MVSSSQTKSNQKGGSCEKSAKPNNKEKIDENPKPRSEKKEAHEETKTLKSRVWSQGETFLNNTTQKVFVLSFLLYSLSLSITLFCSLLIKVLSYFDRKRDNNTHHEIVFAKTRLGRTIITLL